MLTFDCRCDIRFGNKKFDPIKNWKIHAHAISCFIFNPSIWLNLKELEEPVTFQSINSGFQSAKVTENIIPNIEGMENSSVTCHDQSSNIND